MNDETPKNNENVVAEKPKQRDNWRIARFVARFVQSFSSRKTDHNGLRYHAIDCKTVHAEYGIFKIPIIFALDL